MPTQPSKFAQDVKSAYESELIPKRRLGDKNFDESDHAKLILGAFNFFIHVVDRYLFHMDSKTRETVLNFIFDHLVRVYAKSFTGSPAETEKSVFNHYDRRAPQLAEAPTIFGEGLEDKNTAMWRACRAICDEDLGRDDRRLLFIMETHLMQGLESLALADRITAMAEALGLPSHLRKTAQNNR